MQRKTALKRLSSSAEYMSDKDILMLSQADSNHR